MLPNNTTSDIINLLGQRTEFLECLQETPKDKRTLVEDLDCSRSTIDRGVRELESLGLLAYDAAGYEATSCGQLAAEEYRQFERRIETLFELEPLFKWISPSALDLELEWLADAELLVPEPGDPYSMINRHVQRVKEANSGQFLLPYVGQHATEAGYESIHQNDGHHELIVSTTVAENLTGNSAYTALFEEMIDTGLLHIYVYDGLFPYSLAVVDEELIQIVVDEDEEPRAMVETNAPKAVAWAQQKIEEYKQQSTKLDLEKGLRLEPTDD